MNFKTNFLFFFIFYSFNLLGKAPVRGFDKPHHPGSFIVGLKDEPGIEDISVFSDLESTFGGNIKESFSSSRSFVFEVTGILSTQDTINIANKIAEKPQVAFVEANTILKINEQIQETVGVTPNDPQFSKLWGLYHKTKISHIGAPQAWSINTGSKQITVAVIDTGIELKHPDLKDNIWINPGESGLDDRGLDKASNHIDDDQNGFIDDVSGWDFVENDKNPQDDNGHGTHCAGTIGASGNNSTGVVGINWQVSLVGLKFMNGSGTGSLVDALKAIEYATAMNFAISSNSWGGGGYSEALFRGFQAASQRGMLLVVAAGNDGLDLDKNPEYPASYKVPGLISVAATDINQGLAIFSNRGKGSVHIGAPGVDIFSTYKGLSYATLSGTSMAGPHVAGAAALIKATLLSSSENITGETLKNILLSTTTPLTSLTGKTISGGRLNLAKAMEKATQENPESPENPENPETPQPLPKIETLSILDKSSTGLKIKWQSYGPTGILNIQAKISQNPIYQIDQWDQGQDAPVQTTDQTAFIGPLPWGYEGYLTVRPLDLKGRLGDLYPSIAFALVSGQPQYLFDGSSLINVSPTPDWNLETVDGRSTYSASPEGRYRPNQDSSLTFGMWQKTSDQMKILITHKFLLEKDYDFGNLEISADQGKSWRVVQQFTGNSSWQTSSLNLSYLLTKIKKDTPMLLRVRLLSDSSGHIGGWWINRVEILK